MHTEVLEGLHGQRVVPVKQSTAVRASTASATAASAGTSRRFDPRYLITAAERTGGYGLRRANPRLTNESASARC